MEDNERRPSSADASMKWLLIVFNLIFLITGISMIATGAYLTVYPLTSHNSGQMNVTTNEYFFDVRFFSLVNTLYTLGTIIAVTSFLGFIGALMESVFILMLFSTCLAIIFIMELTLVATGYTMKEHIKDTLAGAMNVMMHDYESNNASRHTIDSIQKVFHCCGINGCEDWQKNFLMFTEYNPDAEGFLPHKPLPYMTFDTCRVNTSEGLVSVRLPSSCCEKHRLNGKCLEVSERGCITQLGFLVWRYYLHLAFFFLSTQATGVIIACLLARSLYVQKIKRGLSYSLMQEELVLNSPS